MFSQENEFVDVDASVVDIAIDEELSFVELTDDLTLGEDDIYHLPPHFRCAAHTLNLVVTQDTKKCYENTSLKKVARSTFSICQAIWNKQSRSTSAADLMRDA